MIKRTVSVLALVLLCGCFKVKDELTLNADGSGVIRLESRTTLPAEMLAGMSMNRNNAQAGIYPPVSAAEVKGFFTDKDFDVTSKETKDNGATVLTIEAKFKDINALLASPYAKAHGLTIHIEQGVLRVRGVSGIEAAARFAEVKDDTGQMAAAFGAADTEKQKQEMRSEFRIVLPNEAASATGTREGKAVTWILERAKFTNGTEFAERSGLVLEASCPATGLGFSPTNPPRLALLPFSEVTTGAMTQGRAVDAKKVSESARFVPYALHVTRTLDLAGEGSWGQNQAQLVGAVTVPSDLAPQRWGEAKLEEALDAKGNDLRPKRGSEGFFGNWSSHRSFVEEPDEEEETQVTKAPAEKLERHQVTLHFQPPEWQVQEIARVKGTLALQYFGGSEIVKITNAIPAKWVVDASNPQALASINFSSNEKTISHPRLTELGLRLSVPMAMTQSGMTTLMLQSESAQSGITDVQVFDAQGKPWPTFLQPQGMGNDQSLTLMIAGKPEAPLSLAVVANAAGQTVTVPILVEKVAVRGK